VIYLLHGLQATDAQWDDLGADESAARLITTGEIAPLILVMPWERRGLDYEVAITDVLVPWVDDTFRTIGASDGRAIGGLSRGAGWALRIAFQNPGLFSAVGLHSPAVLAPDLYYIPGWIEAMRPQDIPRVWVDIGERDPLRPSTLELTAVFDRAGLGYEWHLNPGTHLAEYWMAHMDEYLQWYAESWK
jgi:enterochelin esterase-like enzyme